MAENQEFLSAHQCFIVFDSLSKRIAVSIRNRLSKEGIKCTIWDEKHFEDNEYRLSNYNRILFLSSKYADEYLSNPEIKLETIKDFVVYRREGRTAALTLVNSKVNLDDISKELEDKYKELVNKAEKITKKDKEVLSSLTPEELTESLALAIENETKLLPAPQQKSEEKKSSTTLKEAARIVGEYGGAFLSGALIGAFPIASAAVGAALITYGVKNANDSKRALLFAGALVFEKQYLNDFVNAE